MSRDSSVADNNSFLGGRGESDYITMMQIFLHFNKRLNFGNKTLKISGNPISHLLATPLRRDTSLSEPRHFFQTCDDQARHIKSLYNRMHWTNKKCMEWLNKYETYCIKDGLLTEISVFFCYTRIFCLIKKKSMEKKFYPSSN